MKPRAATALLAAARRLIRLARRVNPAIVRHDPVDDLLGVLQRQREHDRGE